jgi:hypothetical protein
LKRKNPLSYAECHKIIDDIDHKLCNICLQWMPFENEFYKNEMNKVDGRNPYCKDCTKKKSTKWRHDNPEKHRVHFTTMNNKKIHKVYKQINNKKRKENGDISAWLKDNPDRQREYGRRQRERKHKLTEYQWDACRLYFNYRCAYCDKTWEQNKLETKKDLHKEHFDFSGVNNLSNCLPSCRDCNSHKWEFPFEEWYTEDNPVYDLDRKQKLYKWINDDHKSYLNIGHKTTLSCPF